MTITWHVDDLKISHQDKREVTKMIHKLRKLYGKHRELSVSRGKVHEYLGMIFDFRKRMRKD